ncbi:hypothetical protein T4B_11275 [Trichinella pseudospiralis]|uniref:Uncharacterized protein n=1 Tax=Trichinella pseudospiralis TaxID=6337 RepID=A0A0V1HXB7_TRIPS|nr:hypothetical protein T4B_11275 [Trichinella pseudospiralis]
MLSRCHRADASVHSSNNLPNAVGRNITEPEADSLVPVCEWLHKIRSENADDTKCRSRTARSNTKEDKRYMRRFPVGPNSVSQGKGYLEKVNTWSYTQQN